MIASGVDSLALPLNRRRSLRKALFVIALLLSVVSLAVLVALLFAGLFMLVYLLAPTFMVILIIPFTIVWATRPSRLPAADPVLDRTGIRLSADGRVLRRDVFLPWDRVSRLSVMLRTLAIDPVDWADLGGVDAADRERWTRRRTEKSGTPWALDYALAKGMPPKAQLRAIVADLSGGRVNLL